jgi:plasmid maintenance system antidote protein VapI
MHTDKTGVYSGLLREVAIATGSRHPFGEALMRHKLRKPGLSQMRLAQLTGYDQAILARMCKGGKDLTGPSGRDRVVRLIGTLADEGVPASCAI